MPFYIMGGSPEGNRTSNQTELIVMLDRKCFKQKRSMGGLENVRVKKTPLFEFDIPAAHPCRKHAVGLESADKQAR